MANEMLVTSVTDLFASEVLAAEFLYTLAPRDGSLIGHPVMQSYRKGAPGGSNVVKVPIMGIGADLLADITPGTEVANTAFTDSHVDVTIAGKGLRRAVGDLARYVTMGRLGPQTWAQDLAISYIQTLISMIANVGDDFTATAGSTGVNLTWDDIQAAKTILGVNDAEGPLMCVLHPQQWGDLEADALSMGEIPAAAGLAGSINARLSSYKGNFFGIDFYTSSHVPTANAAADRAGCLLAPGAIAWADAEIPDEGDPNMVNLGRARLERVRKGEKFETDWVMSYFVGVTKAIDDAGVSIISDA